MKYLIPFVYPAQVVLKRQRHFRNEVYLSSVEVEIPVVPGADVPVAATVTDSRDTRVFRHHNGKFYVNNLEGMTIDDIISGEQADRFAGYLPHAHNDRRYVELVQFWREKPDRKESDVVGAENVRGWGHSSKEEWSQRVRENLSKIAIIDGAVWHRVPEPRLVVNTSFVNPAPHLTTDDFELDRQWRKDSPAGNLHLLYASNFNLGDMDLAEDWLRSHSKDVWKPVSVEVFDPSVFLFDRAQDLSIRLASSFLNGVASELVTKSDSFVETWKDIRIAARSAGDRETQTYLAERISSCLHEIEYAPLRERLEQVLDDWSQAAPPKARPTAGNGLHR
ncbi:hypothetical protein OIU34_23255 [Pararhizobium sp. BT-229]|uniref:hypothetical protein n=1 Tax=Pararhizobium sp. BT-229 TaxID=2986923 RepID=UPI0021F7DEAC|nr:hypothetical protein [Pararhizobium sp. BT-229]MCV9964814.1 hypothetical protein [Pararhizobium sp. BT-229]